LEDSIRKMYDDARQVAESRKARLDKQGKPYFDRIRVHMWVRDLAGEEENDCYRYIFSGVSDNVSWCRFDLSDDQPIDEAGGYGYEITEFSEFIDEPLHAATVYAQFLHYLAASERQYIRISSQLKSLMNLPASCGKKWDNMFAQLDKFGGKWFCAPMLAMIGNFKLTPQNICNTARYSYQIVIDHE